MRKRLRGRIRIRDSHQISRKTSDHCSIVQQNQRNWISSKVGTGGKAAVQGPVWIQARDICLCQSTARVEEETRENNFSIRLQRQGVDAGANLQSGVESGIERAVGVQAQHAVASG